MAAACGQVWGHSSWPAVTCEGAESWRGPSIDSPGCEVLERGSFRVPTSRWGLVGAVSERPDGTAPMVVVTSSLIVSPGITCSARRIGFVHEKFTGRERYGREKAHCSLKGHSTVKKRLTSRSSNTCKLMQTTDLHKAISSSSNHYKN